MSNPITVLRMQEQKHWENVGANDDLVTQYVVIIVNYYHLYVLFIHFLSSDFYAEIIIFEPLTVWFCPSLSVIL